MVEKENDLIIIGLMKILKKTNTNITYKEAKKEFKRMYYPEGFLEDKENDMETPGR